MAWELRADLTGPAGSDADVTDHVAAPDPHPQYITTAEAEAALASYAPLASPAFTGTPTGITKAHVGLGNVDNTADTAKPVSSAQQSALDLKAPLASPAFTGTPTGITKAHVGLGDVDNTADSAKPVSSAQQSALDLKAPLASPAFTGSPTGITKSHVGLGNVDNTSDANKPVSSAQQTALDGKQPLDTDLTTIAGLTATTDSILQAKSSAWTTRTPAQLKTDLAIVAGDITSGTFAIARIPTGTTSSTVAIGNDTRLSVKPYPPVTVTYAATVSINAALGTHFRISATGNCQLLATTNATDGQVIVVQFKSDGTARTLSLATGSSQTFAFGSDITALTATAINKTDLIQFMYDSTAARWWPIAYVKGF